MDPESKKFGYKCRGVLKMKVFVTRKIPGNYLENLKKAGHEVEVSETDRALTDIELVERVKGADAIISMVTERIDGDLMDAAGPGLKIISNYAVGFDNIDVSAATDRGILIVNAPSEEVNESVAEHTWSLILALANRIVEADEFVRQGHFKGWEPGLFLGTNLIGKTLGIVGLGRIGTMVARRAQGWKMQVVYYKRTRDLTCEKEMGISYCPLDEVLRKSDFLSLHIPLTDETTHFINSQTLAKMKKGSYLINTARGKVVNEKDLIASLKSGHLAGAALDVFEDEKNVNKVLLKMPNTITTPHIASATNEARNKMGEMATKAIIEVFSGKKPETLVNKEVWERRRN